LQCGVRSKPEKIIVTEVLNGRLPGEITADLTQGGCPEELARRLVNPIYNGIIREYNNMQESKC
jgi:hypothetical protein